MASPNDRMRLHTGDITELEVDAIVNAANTRLAGGGGVDGAIHRAAGPKLLEACKSLGGCPTGDARLTPGFNLPARHVIHAVGPVYEDGSHGERDLLASAYRRSMEIAAEQDFRSVAFSALSTGVYGYPFEEAEEIAFQTVAEQLDAHPQIEEAVFVFFSEDQYERAQQVFDKVRGAG